MTKDESYPYSGITLPVPTSSSPTNPEPRENPPLVPFVLSTRSYNRSASKEHPDSDDVDSFGFEGQITMQRDSFGEIIGITLDPYWTDGGPIPPHHHMEVTGRVTFVDEGDGC